MIFTYWKACSCSCAVILLLLVYSAFSAYHINKERKPDDPERKDFHPLSPWLAPATPFLWLVRYIVLAPWSIPFGIFLIIFPFMLILLRPISPNDPIRRFILKFGNSVLKINTRLLHAMGLQSPQSIRLISFE
jgi:hypothetical protein